MPIVVVANPKGGVGKSTIATQVAGYWASRGHAVMLGDADRQQSSHLWLSLRSPALPAIATWEVTPDHIARPPKGATHLVLDTPAGLTGWRFKDVLKVADRIIVPLSASLFDIYATRAFLDELQNMSQEGKTQVGIVGMRVDERTKAAEQLHTFVDSLKLPVLGFLRPTQNYVQLAARGLTLWDVARSRVEKDLEQWQPICDWLDKARAR